MAHAPNHLGPEQGSPTLAGRRSSSGTTDIDSEEDARNQAIRPSA